jgi:Holliday junction resolvase RusA-like endonuclease
MTASDVIVRLTATTVTPADGKAKASRGAPSLHGGVPAEPGLYAWWVAPGVLPGVTGPPHPRERRELLYVGIAPSRAASQASLRSVVGQHLGGNINTSTFRLSLAALLSERQGWHPIWRGERPRLTPEDDKRLSDWQQQNLRLSWAVQSAPWRVEGAVIAALAPPLNLADNSSHPLHATLSRARDDLRGRALGGPTTDTPRLPYQPPGAEYIVGYDISTTPMTRNVATRRRVSVTRWLEAISTAARAAAHTTQWSVEWRYAAVIEIRIPWDADIDNFLKDVLDKSKDAGVFAGDDKGVDLIHGIKLRGVSDAEAGARVEVWRFTGAPPMKPR